MTSAEALDRERISGAMASSGDASRWRWFWLACIAMSIPMVIPYLIGMWDFEHYQYFPFVFLVVGYLAYTRSDGIFRAPRGWAGWTAVAIGVLCVVGSLLAPSAWLAGVAFVIFSMACLHSMQGEDDRSLLAAGLPLLMLIQLPVGLDNWLITRLQRITTQLASVILDIVTVPHAVSGNIIELPSRELFVAEACSGIQSVFTLAFLACVLIGWNRRRLWMTPFYLVIAMLLAVAGNVIRVTTVALAEAWGGIDLASGWQHEMVGYFALGISGLLLLSFDQLIITLLHPISTGSSEMVLNPLIRGWNFLVADWRYTDEETGYGYRPERKRDRKRSSDVWLNRFVMGRVGWYAVLGFVVIVTLGAATQATRVEVNRDPEPIIRSSLVLDPTADLLQGDYRVMTVTDHESTRNGAEPRLGRNADLWQAQVGPYTGQLVVSQTYSGWHELCTCYENLQWDLVDREVSQAEMETSTTDEAESFVTARFKRPDGTYGYLMFTAVNHDGTVPPAPSSFGAFGARFFSRLERHGVVEQKDLVMLQFWMVTPEKLDADVLKRAQQDFVDIRSRIADAIGGGSGAPASAEGGPSA